MIRDRGDYRVAGGAQGMWQWPWGQKVTGGAHEDTGVAADAQRTEWMPRGTWSGQGCHRHMAGRLAMPKGP